MSSHHIVRDQQEPALLIMDIAGIPYNAVVPLLEWSPTILVNSGCIEKITSWGIKVDVIVGKKLPLDQPTVAFVQTEAILPASLQYLIEHEYEAVNVIGSVEELQLAIAPYHQQLHVVIINKDYKAVFANNRFSKWVTKGTHFRIMPESKNYALRGLEKKDHILMSSTDGKIEITAPGNFWVMELR